MTFRVRTTGALSVTTPNIAESIRADGTVASHTEDYTTAALQTGEYKITKDFVTPRFRQKIESGEIVNNPFHTETYKKSHSYTPSCARNTAAVGTAIRDVTNTLGYTKPTGYGDRPSVNEGDLMKLAGTEAQSAILKPALESLVEAAESGKTLELFDFRVKALRAHLSDLHRFASRKGKLVKGVKFMSNYWLKYRYGIMPLVKSIDSALVGIGQVRAVRQTARGQASGDADSVHISTNNTGGFWNATFTHAHSVHLQVRAGVLYEWYQGYNEFGSSLSDIPSAAWELIPYSFVVDWFANVGSYIRAITPRAGVRTLAAWTTLKWRHDTVTSANYTWKGTLPSIEVTRPTGQEFYSYQATQRIPQIYTGVVVSLNSFKRVNTPKRIVDAFALCAQQFLR